MYIIFQVVEIKNSVKEKNLGYAEDTTFIADIEPEIEVLMHRRTNESRPLNPIGVTWLY